MDFQSIETARAALPISAAQLCREADIAATTYWRIKAKRQAAEDATLRKLNAALIRLQTRAPIADPSDGDYGESVLGLRSPGAMRAIRRAKRRKPHARARRKGKGT